MSEYPVTVEWYGDDNKMVMIKESYMGSGVYCTKDDVDLLIRQLKIVYPDMVDI